MREHLTRAQQFDASAARELRGPLLPPLAARAWSVFGDLHATRSMGMSGVGPIAYSELDAYCRVTATRLTPCDVQLVRVADDAFLAEMAERLAPDTTPDLPELA